MANAAYLRKSRKDREMGEQTTEETLAKHEKILTDLAAKKGMTINKVYREMVSGESIQDRPVMQQLIADIYANKYEHVFVVEIQRLARGATTDQGRVADAFKFSNTKIITPLKSYDPNDPFDEEYFEFELFMSRNEFKTINRRMGRGRLLSVQSGNYLGPVAPYGYDILKRAKFDRTLTPNHETETLQLMFKWLVEDGLTPADISRKLTELGIPTKSGKKEWRIETVREILRNDVYIGKLHWGKRPVERVYDGEKVVKKVTKKTEYMIIDGKHEGLIDEETFQKAQEIMKSRSTPIKVNNKIANPLASVLICKKCGRAMCRNVFGHCRDRLVHPHSRICNVKSSALEDIVLAVCHGLKHHIADFEFRMTDQHEHDRSNRLRSEIKILEKELDDQKKRKLKAFEGYESGVYSNEEFIERRDTISARIQEVEGLLSKLLTEIPEKVDYQQRIIRCHDVIDSLKDPNIDAAAKNRLVKDVIKSIEYSHDGKKAVLDITLY